MYVVNNTNFRFSIRSVISLFPVTVSFNPGGEEADALGRRT
jgi:hypothetical protein